MRWSSSINAKSWPSWKSTSYMPPSRTARTVAGFCTHQDCTPGLRSGTSTTSPGLNFAIVHNLSVDFCQGYPSKSRYASTTDGPPSNIVRHQYRPDDSASMRRAMRTKDTSMSSVVNNQQGWVSAAVFSHPDIYQQELEQVFG